jgi:hypothetical protein
MVDDRADKPGGRVWCLEWGEGILSRHQFLILSNHVRALKNSISASNFGYQKFTQEIALKRSQ